MNKFAMNYNDFKNFIKLMEKHKIDLKSEKATRLFNEYKKVIA